MDETILSLYRQCARHPDLPIADAYNSLVADWQTWGYCYSDESLIKNRLHVYQNKHIVIKTVELLLRLNKKY